VDSERIGADGALITRTVLISSSETPTVADLLPPPGPSQGAPVEDRGPGDPAAWELARVGRTLPPISSGSSTFAPVWVPTEPPLVLAAAYDGALTAFDATDPTGTVRWRFHAGGTFFGQPGYDPASGRIFVGAGDKRLYALDSRGVFLWSFQSDDNVATRPVVAGGVVVFGSEDRTIYGLDVATGRPAWKRPLAVTGPVVASPVVAGGLVLIGSDDGQVYGLDPATGEERWEQPFVAEDAIEAPLVAAGDGVYVASRDGNVYRLDPATGEETWRGETGGALRTAPAIGAGRVFVVDELGYLKALDLESGRRRWSSPSNDYAGPPVLVGVDAGRPALVAVREDGAVELLDLDGRRLRSWSAADVRSPTEDEPGVYFGATAGGGALWLADDNAVLLRLGAPLAGPTALKAAWYRNASEAPFAAASGLGLYYTAVDYRGRAVLLDRGANIYLVDPASGSAERLGRYEGVEMLPPFAPDAALAGDTLLLNGAASLGAVDLRDGRTLWSFAPGDVLSYRPAVVAGDTALWLAGGTGTPQGSGTLYALDLATGEERWAVELDGLFATGGLFVRGEIVYTATPPAAFDLRTGRQLWRAALPGLALGGPALSDDGGTLFVGLVADPSGLVAAIDTSDGAMRWAVQLDTALNFTERLWLSGDTLIVPTMDDRIVALDAADGAERWRAAPGRRWGTVSVVDGKVWQMNVDGHVFVLDARDGSMAHFYTAIDASLEILGMAAGRAAPVGGRMVLPHGSGLIAFEVPR
jgi:outer membrane protein assembly factor BamB